MPQAGHGTAAVHRMDDSHHDHGVPFDHCGRHCSATHYTMIVRATVTMCICATSIMVCAYMCCLLKLMMMPSGCDETFSPYDIMIIMMMLM